MTKKRRNIIKNSIRKVAGRKPAIAQETIYEVLKNMQIFDESGKLKTEVDSVWKEASEALENKMKIHNLYIHIRQNRHQILNKLKYYKDNINKEEVYKDVTSLNKNLEKLVETKKENNLLENLHLLKSNVEFHSVIKEICARPFYIIYCCPEQIELWRKYHQFNKAVCLSVSTGLIETAKLLSYESNDLIVFTLTGEVQGNILPYFQVISEKYYEQFVFYILCEWLREWVKKNKKRKTADIQNNPSIRTFIVLPSLVLIRAAIKTLNNCSLEFYMEKCFNFFKNSNNFDKFLNVIRIDIIPIINIFEKLFEEKFDSVKEFFIRCIFYLQSIDTRDDFENTVRNIFILLQSECMNLDTDMARKDLLTKINEPRRSLMILSI